MSSKTTLLSECAPSWTVRNSAFFSSGSDVDGVFLLLLVGNVPGTILIGVSTSGQVSGLFMDRDKRDEMRMGLELLKQRVVHPPLLNEQVRWRFANVYSRCDRQDDRRIPNKYVIGEIQRPLNERKRVARSFNLCCCFCRDQSLPRPESDEVVPSKVARRCLESFHSKTRRWRLQMLQSECHGNQSLSSSSS